MSIFVQVLSIKCRGSVIELLVQLLSRYCPYPILSNFCFFSWLCIATMVMDFLKMDFLKAHQNDDGEQEQVIYLGAVFGAVYCFCKLQIPSCRWSFFLKMTSWTCACISSIRGLHPLIIPQVGLRLTIATLLITIMGKVVSRQSGLRHLNGLMSRGRFKDGTDFWGGRTLG